MKKKYKIGIIVIVSFFVLSIIFGVSFAMWTKSASQTGENTLASLDCFDIEMQETSNEIVQENAFPITDEEGLKTKPYTFKLTNKCEYMVKPSAILDIDKTDNLNLSHFKVYLTNDDYEWYPELLSEKENEINSDTSKYHKIVMETILNSYEERSYSLRLWMDEKVTIDDVIGSLRAKLRIVVDPYKEEVKDICSIQVKDENPGEFRGSGTEADPYLIESMEDLVALSVKTNNGEVVSNSYYALTTDLDATCDASYVDPNTFSFGSYDGKGNMPLKYGVVNIGFIPIGTQEHPFTANFSGRNHTIQGLNIKNKAYSGLFGNLKTTNSIQIRNLKVSADIAGYSVNAAGILASTAEGMVVINNVQTFGNINVPRGYVGGVIGSIDNSYIISAINNAEIKDGTSYIGGIVGRSNYGLIRKAINKGNINVNGTSSDYVGGIVGYENMSSNLSELTNYGNITKNNASRVGGVIGYSSSRNIISILKNYGDITATGYALGGVIGSADSTMIKDAYNYGTLVFTASYRGNGGVIGDLDNGAARNCYNFGNITFSGSSTYAGIGGVIGYIDSGGSYSNVYSLGNASEKLTINGFALNIGGVIGEIGSGSETIKNVYNKADIEVVSNQAGTSSIGGIAGKGRTASTNLENSYNVGNIKVSSTLSNFYVNLGVIVGDTSYSYPLFSNTYSISDLDVDLASSESSNNLVTLYGGDTIYKNLSNYLYRGKVKSNVLVSGIGNKVYGNLNNIYLDVTSLNSTSIKQNFYTTISDGTASNLFYKISGITGYNINEGSTEYNFDSVNSLWFKNTLNLGSSFEYNDGYYPLLYQLDTNGNLTSELLQGQVKKAIQ